MHLAEPSWACDLVLETLYLQFVIATPGCTGWAQDSVLDTLYFQFVLVICTCSLYLQHLAAPSWACDTRSETWGTPGAPQGGWKGLAELFISVALLSTHLQIRKI